MSKEEKQRAAHVCDCPDCLRHPHGSTASQHRALNRLLVLTDERSRRLVAGFLAWQYGRGGISRLACVTGLDRNTITRGLRELHQAKPLPQGRVRRPGGGRKRVEAKCPGS